MSKHSIEDRQKVKDWDYIEAVDLIGYVPPSPGKHHCVGVATPALSATIKTNQQRRYQEQERLAMFAIAVSALHQPGKALDLRIEL